MKRARRAGVGTKKGRALKTLTKLLNTCVCRPFLYSRNGMPRLREDETNQKNKRIVAGTAKAVNFQTAQNSTNKIFSK